MFYYLCLYLYLWRDLIMFNMKTYVTLTIRALIVSSNNVNTRVVFWWRCNYKLTLEMQSARLPMQQPNASELAFRPTDNSWSQLEPTVTDFCLLWGVRKMLFCDVGLFRAPCTTIALWAIEQVESTLCIKRCIFCLNKLCVNISQVLPSFEYQITNAGY